MDTTTEEEQARLDALLERFALTRYREQILAQAAPCIAMALDDPPDPRPEVWPQQPLGVSKVGGAPDLPREWSWPMNGSERAGFFLQLALAELPRVTWNPLPTHGMLYLFCWTDLVALDAPGWEVLWWEGSMNALRRTPHSPAPLNAEIEENEFFVSPDARRLKLRAGTDFPPGCQQDWDFVRALEALGRANGDDGVLDRYFGFSERAADPDVEVDQAKGRGPYFYPVGRLFGHTDRSIRHSVVLAERGEADRIYDYDHRKKQQAELDRAGAAWRQIMRLDSNPATGYMSPYDAAPVYVMAEDPGTRPWAPVGRVYGLAAK